MSGLEQILAIIALLTSLSSAIFMELGLLLLLFVALTVYAFHINTCLPPAFLARIFLGTTNFSASFASAQNSRPNVTSQSVYFLLVLTITGKITL